MATYLSFQKPVFVTQYTRGSSGLVLVNEVLWYTLEEIITIHELNFYVREMSAWETKKNIK